MDTRGIRRRDKLLEEVNSSVSDSMSAAASKAWIESPTSSIDRLLELNQADGGSYDVGTPGDFRPDTHITGFVDKNAALERTKEAGVDLQIPDHGIKSEALDILIARKREEMKRQSTLSRAPDGFWSGTAQISASLAASLMDPINVASAFVPVYGQAKYGRMLATAKGATGRLAVRSRVGAIEGAVGAALVEPIVLTAATAEQADYDLSESMMNVAFGVVMGSGLHSGAGAISDALSKTRLADRKAAAKVAIAQALDDKPIDVRPVVDNAPRFKGMTTGNVVSRLKGDEVINSTSNIVADARTFFQNNLQGNHVLRRGFGEIKITGRGWKKMRSGLPNDPLKAQLIPAIPDIIKHGEYKGRSELYKERKDNFKYFHRFEADVEINGKPVLVGVTVGEDGFGKLFYNMNHNPHLIWDKRKPQLLPRRDARGAEASRSEGIPPESGNSIDLDQDPINIDILDKDERDLVAGQMRDLERSNTVKSKLADEQASISAEETVKESLVDDTEDVLRAVEDELRELSEALDVDVTNTLKPHDEAIAAAEGDAMALRAAAICALRKS